MICLSFSPPRRHADGKTAAHRLYAIIRDAPPLRNPRQKATFLLLFKNFKKSEIRYCILWESVLL